nr:hypothetical protein [Tanacetum cinerariifolium]
MAEENAFLVDYAEGRAQDSDKGKGKEIDGPSVNMTEEVKNKNNKQNKGKKRDFKEYGSGSGFNKKPKLECWKCGKTGHFKRDCRSGNKKNANAGSSGKGSKDYSQGQAPYTRQQNSVAERKNRALKEMVNSMLSYSGLSEGFWGEAMLTDCYLLNMVSNKRNKTIPYELWFHVIEPNNSISINSIIESRDAIFDENHFSLIPRPKDIIPNVQESQMDDHTDDVPNEILEPRKEAIDDEIGSIMENNTWVLSDLPHGCKPLGCKWIFKRKMKVDGTIDKFKARLVIQAIYNLVIHQMDVKTSFLNGDLDEKVYMKLPKIFVMPGNEHKPLSPPATTALKESGDSIEKLFDDVDQEQAIKKSDGVLEEPIAKDASEVVAEKARKKQKRKVVGDASGSTYPPKKLRDDHQSLLSNTGGKSLAALRGMVPDGSAIPSGATEPLIAASIAPVSDAGPLDSMSGPNLRTCPPHVRSSDADAPVVTVAITTTIDADVAAGSKAKDVSKDFENIKDSTSAGGVNADAASILGLKKTSTSSNSFYASQSQILKPYILYSEFNVGAARQVCLRAEVRMRVKHNLERKDDTKSIKLRDLKEENFALEGEISALSERVTTLESLSCDELNSKVASLESKINCLAAEALGWANGFAVNKGINDGLKAGIDHGKVRRDLSMVKAYDPSAEEKYADAVNALGGVDFSLLSELESKKDSSIVDLMDFFTWRALW